jgi:Lsr2
VRPVTGTIRRGSSGSQFPAWRQRRWPRKVVQVPPEPYYVCGLRCAVAHGWLLDRQAPPSSRKVTADVQRTARNVNGGLLRPYSESIVYAYALFNEWNGVHVAQKIQTLFIDDIDGSEAEGTVRFALDGAEYEIDLNAKHAEALRKSLARYVDAARRSSGGSTRRPARSGRRTAASGLNTTEVREWAKAQGIEVKDRGRVPAELVVRFRAATGN